MNYILLDVGMPAASWLGIITVIVMGILGFALKKIIDNMEGQVKDLEEESKKTNTELRALDTKINDVSKHVETRITDLNLNILDKLTDIKDKFYDLRK